MKNNVGAMLVASLVGTMFVVGPSPAAAANSLPEGQQLTPDSGFVTADGRIGHPFSGPHYPQPVGSAIDSETTYNINGYNWGGSVSTQSGINFLSVTGGFTIPTTITCSSFHDLFAPWVGLNGYTNGTVQQTGVAITCSSGVPQYQAWYEMYPASPVYYSTSSYPVVAGDYILASVSNDPSNPGTYTMSLTNLGKWTATTTQSGGPTTAESAEAVTEAPMPYHDYPNFGSVLFNNLSGNSTPGTMNYVFKGFAGSPPVLSLDANAIGVVQTQAGSMVYTGATHHASFTNTYMHE